MNLAPQDWPPPPHDHPFHLYSSLHHQIHFFPHHHHHLPSDPSDLSQLPPKPFLSASHLFSCFPPKPDPKSRPRAPALSHSGPIKLVAPPIVGHSGPLKVPPPRVAPSILPADALGQKTPLGYRAEEPTSPEVTCLGRVKIKQRNRNERVRDADKQQVGEWKNSKVKKTESSDSPGKWKQAASWKKNWGTRDTTEPSGKIDFAIDLDRFGSACAVLSSIPSESTGSRAERRAILTKSLVHLFGKNRSETIDDEYVPQLPPPNALLLIRGSRNFERESGQPGFADPEQLSDVIKKAAKRQVSLPKPPPDSSLWKRRGIGEISSLNISKPIKLEISLPSTT